MRIAAVVRARFSALLKDRRGSVAVLSGAFGLCLLASLAISVDVAGVYLARRTQQGALDLASIAAARDLTKAEAAARLSLAQNGVAAPAVLKVTLGHYEPDASKAANARFVANGAPANAVRLEMQNPATLVFGKGLIGGAAPTLSTVSTAANTRLVSVTIGSRLASLNGGVANVMLSALLGANVSLTAMDYAALAAAQIDMPDLLNAIAPKVGLSAGTYDEVLKSNPSLSQVASALGGLPGVGATAKSAITAISGANAGLKIDLSRMIAFGPFAKLKVGKATGLSATASALDVLTTGLGVANGGKQLSLNLGAQVPGVLGLTAAVTIGERPQSSPWIALGAEGVTVRTAQTRVRLIASVGGALGLAELRLALAADVAAGEATLTVASCGRVPQTDAAATLAVKPSLAGLWVGEPKNLTAWNNMTLAPDIGPATVLDVPLVLSMTASAHVAAANMAPKSVAFSASEIAARTVKTVQTTNIAQSTMASLTSSLDVSVTLKLLGLALGTNAFVKQTLGALLTPVGALLDGPLNTVLGLLGVGLGEADVSVRGVRCDGAALIG